MEYAYHVSEQQEHGTEKQIASFVNENDAYTFLQAKVEWGEKMHLRQIYRVYHEDEEIPSDSFGLCVCVQCFTDGVCGK